MSTFLVTGGAGFIGSHIVKKLIYKGQNVKVLDNLHTGKLKNLDFINKVRVDGQYEFIEGDITDINICDYACKDVNYVIHQAALKSVNESFLSPIRYHDVNVSGTLNLLHAAHVHGIKKFVFASSSSVYGESCFKSQEMDKISPMSPYAYSKFIGEKYCEMYNKSGLNTAALRYFNVYGPKQSLGDGYAIVIPKFIESFLKNEKIPIYGDGSQSRDFVYVNDVANANIMAALDYSKEFRTYNVGTGNKTRIIDLYKIIKKITKKENKIVFLDKRMGDVNYSNANIHRIKKELDFIPQISLKDGLKETIDYYSNIIQ